MQQGDPYKAVAPKLFDLDGHHLLSVSLFVPARHQLHVLVLDGGSKNETPFETQQLKGDVQPLTHAPRVQVDVSNNVEELEKVEQHLVVAAAARLQKNFI